MSEWDNRWQLIADNGSLSRLTKTTRHLSTVEMPISTVGMLGYAYESCVFGADESDVVARYQTKEDAIIGHNELCKEYGLS